MDTRPEPELPPPKGDALVQGTSNNSSPRQLPGTDSTFLPSSFSVDSKPIDQLDKSSVSGPATQVASECEFDKRQKNENEEVELEVGCDLYPFRWDVVLTPSQKERKRKELEREKKGKEARKEFEVHRDPHLFRQSTVLTTPQQRQRVLQREKEENEARERKEGREVCLIPTSFGEMSLQPLRRGKRGRGSLNARRKRRRGNVGKSSRYVAIPVSSDRNAILTPLQREKRPEERERRKKEREGEEAVADSSGWVTVGKPPPPRTLYPAETFQNAGGLGPEKNTVGDGFYQSGPSQNSSRAFLHLGVF